MVPVGLKALVGAADEAGLVADFGAGLKPASGGHIGVAGVGVEGGEGAVRGGRGQGGGAGEGEGQGQANGNELSIHIEILQ